MQLARGNLIVFARAPVRGRVKTRLARVLGDGRALQIYLQFLEYILSTATKSGFTIKCYTDEPSHDYFHQWSEKGIAIHPQVGNDIGERMYHAMAAEQSSDRPVILLGSDCPQITCLTLNEVETRLNSGKQVVIVPSDDGGYVLIAFRDQVYPELFQDIAWSTAQVLSQTISKATMLGLSYSLLEPLLDVDTAEDYQRWLSISE